MIDEEEPPIRLGPRDARLVVGTTRFYVKVVRRGDRLLPLDPGAPTDAVSAGALVAAVLVWSAAWSVSGSAAARRIRRSEPGQRAAARLERVQHARGWKIGVVRHGGDRWGPTGPTEVVHVETWPPGPFPEVRVAELTEAASTGRFAEGRRRWGRNPTSV